MSFLPPDRAAALLRGREVLGALAGAAAGLWLVWLGGWLLVPFGLLVTLCALALALVALRRLRFSAPQNDPAPGLVEVLEGQVSYLGPQGGGVLALRDLTEIALAWHDGRRCWRLAAAGEAPLWVPVAALGAEQLFDAFAGLPALDMERLLSALEGPEAVAHVVWRDPARRLMR